MWEYIAPVLWGVLSYLMGSVLWGAIVSRLYGVNIWQVDTRNPGAANVIRNVGLWQGVLVFLADLLTAGLAVLVASRLPHPNWSRAVSVVALQLGAYFSIFYRFRGGTGLAKALGSVMALNPVGFFASAPVAVGLALRLRNPALGGGFAIGVSGLLALALFRDLAGAVLITLVGVMVFTRARIQYRFMRGVTRRVNDSAHLGSVP